MTQPASPPAAAPVAAATPAVPAAPEGPVRTVTKKSYTTEPVRRGGSLGGSLAQPAAPAAAAPTPAAAPQAAAEAPPAGAPPSLDAAPAAASAVATEAPKSILTGDLPPVPTAEGALAAGAAATEMPKVDEFEVAKRMGALARRERKIAEDAQRNSGRLELADVVVKHLGPQDATPQQLQRRLEAFQMVDQGRELAAKDPVGFLQRVFGVDPQVTVRAAVDGAIAQRAKKPEETAAERAAAQDRKIAELEQRIQTGATETAQERATRQVNDYIETAIAPVISSSEKYPFIHRLCKMQGADPKKELYNAMSERYAKTGKAPDPAAFAAELERNIKSHFVPASSLPSANANPGQPATPARAGTPPASEVPRRATVADPPAGIRRRQSAQPYVSRPKAG